MAGFIRVSSGTAAVLGLFKLQNDVPPTTAYLMIDHESKCSANCSFCPQSRSTLGKTSQLSRISWPRFPFEDVAEKLASAYSGQKFFRVCIQTLNYPSLVPDLLEVVVGIREGSHIPISVAVHPLRPSDFQSLQRAGVGRVGIALDGCTPEIFAKVKGAGVNGPYSWKDHLEGIRAAVEIFGRTNVATHFIVGLGETEQEMLQAIQEVVDLGIMPSLFAFTPVKGTAEQTRSPPSLLQYRKMQLGRELIVNQGRRVESFEFSPDGTLLSFQLSPGDLEAILGDGAPFQTQGCQHCNRPYYDSRPRGPIYNYGGTLTDAQKKDVSEMLKLFD